MHVLSERTTFAAGQSSPLIAYRRDPKARFGADVGENEYEGRRVMFGLLSLKEVYLCKDDAALASPRRRTPRQTRSSSR